MAVINNGLPKTKLKSIDIRDTLNANGGKTSNKTSSFFKEDANINKWSKHKPIVTGFKNDIIVPFDSDKWNNQSGSVPVAVNDYKTAWNGCSVDEWYDYQLPKGGEDEPLRKGDFRGYRADATPPFKAFAVDNTEADTTEINGNTTICQIYMRNFLNDEEDPIEGGMLSLKDLGIFNKIGTTYKVAIVDKFKKEGTGTEAWEIYKGDTLSENWVQSNVTLKTWTVNDVGLHELAPVLAADNGNYIPLPFPHRLLRIFKYYGSDTFLSPYASIAYSSLDGELDANATGSSVVLSVSFIQIRGNQTPESHQFHIQMNYGSEAIQSTRLDDVYFTIPDSMKNEAMDFEYKFSKTYRTPNGWRDMIALHKEGNLYISFNGQAVQVV